MKKENITLYIGLAIPIIMVLFIAGAIYIPTLFIDVNPPKFNFMYMINNGSDDHHYTVTKNTLSRKKIEKKNNYYNPNRRAVKFFIHDMQSHKNKEITFEAAAIVSLNTDFESPDGFKVESSRRSHGFFPFYSRRNYYTRYLTKEGYSEKLKLHTTTNNVYYSFRFLGWIK